MEIHKVKEEIDGKEILAMFKADADKAKVEADKIMIGVEKAMEELISDSKKTESFLRDFKKDPVEVRKKTVRIIGEVKNNIKAEVNSLILLVEIMNSDKSIAVQSIAIETMGLTIKGILKHLVDILWDEDKDEKIRNAAEYGLSEVKRLYTPEK